MSELQQQHVKCTDGLKRQAANAEPYVQVCLMPRCFPCLNCNNKASFGTPAGSFFLHTMAVQSCCFCRF